MRELKFRDWDVNGMKDETIEAFNLLKAELEIPYIYKLTIHETNPFLDDVKNIIDWRQWIEIANDGFEAILQSEHKLIVAIGSYEDVKNQILLEIAKHPEPLKGLPIEWRRINNTHATQIKLLIHIKPELSAI